MLVLTVEGDEYFDESNNEFVHPESFILTLEHSLVSLSKWESIYEKPFIGRIEKTNEEILSYVRCMLLYDDVDDTKLSLLSQKNIEEIHTYIESKASATTFREQPGGAGSQEVITAELIYYWLIAYQIPWEAQHWHLNRLFALIRVCDLKNSGKKAPKMSRNEMLAERQRINAQRREHFKSQG